MQKETAERLVAEHSKKAYSSLSVISQVLYNLKLIHKLPSSVFYPIPKVESCFISFTDKRDCFSDKLRKKEFITFVRQAFQQRRKTLLNNFGNLEDKQKIKEFLKEHKLSNLLRAENLSPQNFLDLFCWVRFKN